MKEQDFERWCQWIENDEVAVVIGEGMSVAQWDDGEDLLISKLAKESSNNFIISDNKLNKYGYNQNTASQLYELHNDLINRATLTKFEYLKKIVEVGLVKFWISLSQDAVLEKLLHESPSYKSIGTIDLYQEWQDHPLSRDNTESSRPSNPLNDYTINIVKFFGGCHATESPKISGPWHDIDRQKFISGVDNLYRDGPEDHHATMMIKFIIDELRGKHILFLGCCSSHWYYMGFLLPLIYQQEFGRPDKNSTQKRLFIDDHRYDTLSVENKRVLTECGCEFLSENGNSLKSFLDKLTTKFSKSSLVDLTCRPSIFICYDSDNYTLTKKVVNLLTDFGFNVWFDDSEIDHRARFIHGKIKSAIYNCDVFMPLFTTEILSYSDETIKPDLRKSYALHKECSFYFNSRNDEEANKGNILYPLLINVGKGLGDDLDILFERVIKQGKFHSTSMSFEDALDRNWAHQRLLNIDTSQNSLREKLQTAAGNILSLLNEV